MSECPIIDATALSSVSGGGRVDWLSNGLIAMIAVSSGGLAVAAVHDFIVDRKKFTGAKPR